MLQLESIAQNCLPLFINDDTSRYFDEVLAPDTFEVTLREEKIPDIPTVLEKISAPVQQAMRDRLFCACQARSPLSRHTQRTRAGARPRKPLEVVVHARLLRCSAGRIGSCISIVPLPRRYSTWRHRYHRRWRRRGGRIRTTRWITSMLGAAPVGRGGGKGD